MLNGLLRVRGMTQDDAHIFCTREQLEDELASLLAFVLRLLRRFGLTEFEAELSTRPDKYLGTIEEWDRATEALAAALRACRPRRTRSPKAGAPFMPRRSTSTSATPSAGAGRSRPSRSTSSSRSASKWSTSGRTIPATVLTWSTGHCSARWNDFSPSSSSTTPAPSPPGWPRCRCRCCPCATTTRTTRLGVVGRLREAGFRAEASPADEPLGARVRRAKLEKVPYVLVVGDDDVAAGTVGVNTRGSERPERGVPVADFLQRVQADVDSDEAPAGGTGGSTGALR